MPTELAVHKFVGNTIPYIEIVYRFQSFFEWYVCPIVYWQLSMFPSLSVHRCVPLVCCLIVVT